MFDKPVVHVIDDDEALRESLSFLLGAAQFEVRVQDVGEPGCIITDVRMPGMSRLELLQQLANLGTTFAVNVITGYGDVSLAVEAMKLGAARDLEDDGEKLEIHGRIAAPSNHDLCHLAVKLPTQADRLTFGSDGKLTRHMVT